MHVASGNEKLGGMPSGGERSGFGLAIAHDAASHKIGIVEDCAVSMCQRVAQFSAFVYGARRLRSVVPGYASGEGKLLEQFPHSLFVLLNARINLGVCAFEV